MKIIAESASNHNGNFDYLIEMATKSKKSGADYFTFQMLHLESFCVKEYQQRHIFEKIQFTDSQWSELFDHCRKIQLEVIPCVLDDHSFRLAFSNGSRFVKIHATDLNNFDLLREISEVDGVKVILETQCATMFEIRRAFEVLGEDKVEALFTGFSNYPTEVEELNLNAIDYLGDDFGVQTGYADHSLDTQNIPLMVLAKGCTYLEKHITLSRNDRQFDWQVSLYPNEFALMVNSVRHYSQALGKRSKHPSDSERAFRPIMYKRHVPGKDKMLRADKGEYAMDRMFSENEGVDIAIIARLKSQRLKRKVLCDIQDESLIIKLHKRLTQVQNAESVSLCTSDLMEDQELVEVFKEKGLEWFSGDPVSVADRLLEFGHNRKSGAVFRVTGDNPLTDSELMDRMIEIYKNNDVDYVRVNDVPFGVSAELISMKYLWKLYLNMDDPLVSEYLTWFVLNDEECKKACIDVESGVNDLELINFSVDYKEDLDVVLNFLKKVGKPIEEVVLADMVKYSGDLPRIDSTKEMKLPNHDSIPISKYLEMWRNSNYQLREKHKI